MYRKFAQITFKSIVSHPTKISIRNKPKIHKAKKQIRQMRKLVSFFQEIMPTNLIDIRPFIQISTNPCKNPSTKTNKSQSFQSFPTKTVICGTIIWRGITPSRIITRIIKYRIAKILIGKVGKASSAVGVLEEVEENALKQLNA